MTARTRPAAADHPAATEFGADAVAAMLDRMATAIAEDFPGRRDSLALLGIQLNGVPLARRLARRLRRDCDIEPPVGAIDINMYRDDIGRRREVGRVNPTEIGFDLEDRSIILVDDVLQTGRTIRAALDAITDYGRPRVIRLAVLVDRGGREFPIQADYVGMQQAVPAGARVMVSWQELAGQDAVRIVGGRRRR